MIGQPGDWLLLKGIVAGVLVAAPVGPVNLLCAARSLARGWRAGVVSGLGAAAADTAFAAVAAFGLGLAMEFLAAHRASLTLAGALFLFAYGARILVAPPPGPAAIAEGARAHAGDALSAFLLTLANPITVFSFVGVYAALGIQADARVDGAAATVVAGVFLGATAWWLAVATAASLLRERFAGNGPRWANRISGAVIIGFAVLLLARALA
jgi:threonine/homoserine/homoserine lactone efflux protein